MRMMLFFSKDAIRILFFFFKKKGKIFSNKSKEELVRYGVAVFPAKEIWYSKIPIEVTFHTDIKQGKNCQS